MKITGVILAAGKSSRMEQNKLLMKYKEHTVIEESVYQLVNANVDEVIVITGFESEYIERLLSKSYPDSIRIVYNSNYLSGRAESIKCAVRQIGNQSDAVLFMVADKPGVSGNLINRTIDKFSKDKPLILYVRTPSGRSHPIIFSKKLFCELLSLTGDLIGEELINRYNNDIVELEDMSEQVDIDTEWDYKLLIKRQLP